MNEEETPWCQIFRKDPYFFIINPFAAKNQGEKWADTPRFPDPSLVTQLWKCGMAVANGASNLACYPSILCSLTYDSSGFTHCVHEGRKVLSY